MAVKGALQNAFTCTVCDLGLSPFVRASETLLFDETMHLSRLPNDYTFIVLAREPRPQLVSALRSESDRRASKDELAGSSLW